MGGDQLMGDAGHHGPQRRQGFGVDEILLGFFQTVEGVGQLRLVLLQLFLRLLQTNIVVEGVHALLHRITKLQEQLPVEAAVVVLLPAQHADGAEESAIGPAERQTAIGDHADFDVRIVLPFGILEGIGHQELLAGIHDPFAIEAGVEVFAGPGRIAVVRRLAGDEHFYLARVYPHDEPGRHVKQLSHQVDGLLPGETQGVRDLELGGDRVLG